MAFYNSLKDNFTQIPNGILDADCNPTEIAIITYVASKPTGWNFSCPRIAKGINCTKDTVRKHVNSLIDKGYLIRIKLNTGRIDYYLMFPPNLYSKAEILGSGFRTPKPKKPKEEKTQGGNFRSISNTVFKSNTIDKYIYLSQKHFDRLKVLGIIKKQKTLNDSDLNKYADTLNKLERIDGFTYDEIETVLNFALNDSFWNNKLISLAAIRNKSKNGLSKFENCLNAMNSNTPTAPKKLTPEDRNF